MCFSAEVSFALSGVLLPAGCYCIHRAIRKNRSLIPLSITPVVFGIQQVCEGFVWLGFAQHHAEMVQVSALLFLFFAVSFWPFWIPFLAWIGEPSEKRRRVFAIICFIGLTGGLAAYLPLVLNTHILIAHVANHSIHYNIANSPVFDIVPMELWHCCYLAIVSAPLLASAKRNLVYVGVALVLAALVSHIFFWYSFASVWCFFAAILYLYLCWFFRNVTAPMKLRTVMDTMSFSMPTPGPTGPATPTPAEH